jgi:hypothetical protein
VRLAVVEAIEETGNVLFALTTRLAQAIQRDTGVELRYCGEFHFNLESGHAMNNDHAELARIELSDTDRTDAIERVDAVFAVFTDWTHELLKYARAVHPLEAMRSPSGDQGVRSRQPEASNLPNGSNRIPVGQV